MVYGSGASEVLSPQKKKGGGRRFSHGAFHLVRTQFYMLSGPTHPLFACKTQWKCIGCLTPLDAYVLNGRPPCRRGRGVTKSFGIVLTQELEALAILTGCGCAKGVHP